MLKMFPAEDDSVTPRIGIYSWTVNAGPNSTALITEITPKFVIRITSGGGGEFDSPGFILMPALDTKSGGNTSYSNSPCTIVHRKSNGEIIISVVLGSLLVLSWVFFCAPIKLPMNLRHARSARNGAYEEVGRPHVYNLSPS
jgi:hypothetical protein